MIGRTLLIAIVLPVFAGCSSYTRTSDYDRPSIADAKQGEDCRVQIFGLGGSPDVTMAQAIHVGGITKLRSAEYRVSTIQGVGTECVIARGE